MKFYRAGLIGCGNIGSRYDEGRKGVEVYTHAGLYNALGAFKLACASDINKDRLKEFSRYWKVSNLYEDYRQMLQREYLDVLSIATGDDTHSRIILDALRYRPPRIIFCEKPIAADSKTAEKVFMACLKQKVELVIDYVRRWDKNHQKIKEFIDRAKLGQIFSVTGYYVRGVRHNGCQMINLIQFLFGQINKVQAVGLPGKGSFHNDQSLNLRLITKNATEINMIALDRFKYNFSIFELDIFGTKGRIRLSDGGKTIEFNKVKRDNNFANFNKLFIAKSSWSKPTYGSAMTMAGECFISFLKGEISQLENNAAGSINDLRVIEAALHSAKMNNRIVKVCRQKII